jgi:hypothetical protein
LFAEQIFYKFLLKRIVEYFQTTSLRVFIWDVENVVFQCNNWAINCWHFYWHKNLPKKIVNWIWTIKNIFRWRQAESNKAVKQWQFEFCFTSVLITGLGWPNHWFLRFSKPKYNVLTGRVISGFVLWIRLNGWISRKDYRDF